jgi:acetoin utilization protein AcuC
MSGKVAFIWHDNFLKYQFGPEHPFQPIRERYTLDILKELKVFDKDIKLVEPKPAKESDLLSVHTKDYIDFVKRMCKDGVGYLDIGDTPATKGLYEGALWVVGGSLCGADLIMKGKVIHAFNPGGGLHHAKSSAASGFCVFNDIAIAARHLQKKYKLRRIAIVDVDGHHGDGTQEIFYEEPILKISFHHYGIFPGTGRVEEIGKGAGERYSVNIPFPPGVDDENYLDAFEQIVPPLLRRYKPEVILNQFGVDAHYKDPLVGLSLTTTAYYNITRTMHELAHELCYGRLLMLGGGGYELKQVARCWAIAFLTICGVPRECYAHLFDQESPPSSSEYVRKEVRKVVREVKRLYNL